MTEEIQEIERLIKQSGEFADSLIRLAQKLQERSRRQTHTHEERPEHLAALHKILTDLRSNIDVVKREIVPWRPYNRDEDYAKARTAVVDGTATPQEAVVQLLQVCVADKTMSPDFAVEQLAKLLRPDLSVSRRIQIRQTAKAAFEAGDDVLEKIKPLLKGANPQQGQEHQQIRKTVSVTL
jgi:hypothetical protein